MAELSMRRTGVYAARGDFGFGDFQTPTGSMMPVGTGGTLASILQTASNVVGPLISRFTQQPAQQPSGFGGLLGPYLNRTFPNVSAALAGTPMVSGGGGDLFSSGMPTTVRPLRKVPVTGPDGRLYWFGYLGKPVLFSGDLAAARRVSRVARRAVRASHRRTFRRRR